jgi:hypothetical protein
VSQDAAVDLDRDCICSLGDLRPDDHAMFC